MLCTAAEHWVDVGQLKFGASSFMLSWPTAQQLGWSVTSEQVDDRVIYVTNVGKELCESVLLHLENKRSGGGQTVDSQLMEDGTLMAKFADVKGWGFSIISLM